MPNKYDELKSSIADLLKDSQDVEALKSLGSINQRIDDMAKSEDALIKKHEALVKDYREKVIQDTLFDGKSSKSDPQERDRAPRSIDEIIIDVNAQFKQ